MRERKVTFETSPEKFLGVLMERILWNDAHLRAISEYLARLIGTVECEDSEVILKQIQSTTKETYSQLSASVVASLTQGSADELLSSIEDSDSN